MSKNPTSAKFIKMYSIEYEKEMDSFVIEYDSDAYLTWRFGAFEYRIYMDADYDYMDDDYGATLRYTGVINTETHEVCDLIGKKCNMMWIEDIKKHYEWKAGDVIHLKKEGEEELDGCFYIMRVEDNNHYDYKIDSEGYVVKLYKGSTYGFDDAGNWLGRYDEYDIKVDCMYNDRNGIRIKKELEANL